MTISEFALWFQKNVTGKPLVDRSDLTGRYDFTLTDLYKAFQEQLVLKLQSIKAPVDIMVIEHAEKPSPN